jgi:membrane-associated protein
MNLALTLDPKSILDSLSPYGEIGLIAMIFAETGLLIGFFLPGDSLLFTAALHCRSPRPPGSLNLALVLVGGFVPLVRTLAPVLAGVAGMKRTTFLRFNVVGAALWIAGVTLAGHLLADVIGASIDAYLLPIIAVIVVVSLIPTILEWRRQET